MATKKTAPKKTAKTSRAKAAPKKTTAAKKPVKKTVKKAVSKKKKEMKVGSSYECSVCGLEVSVENVCGCADACDLICCGEPMEMI